MTASGECASERPKGRASLLAHAAFLVLQATAAGARIVTTNFGASLGPRDLHEGRSLFEGLPTPQGGQLLSERPAVGEEQIIASTQVV